MFRFATENDRKSLTELWFNCFGDGEKFVSAFLDNFLTEDNAYIFEENGKAVSVVYALDCEIGTHKAVYFYAVATDENYRRRGLAKAEIEFLTDYKSKKGTEIFLLTPSNEKNRNYYETLGFSDAFFCDKRKFKKTENITEISTDFSNEEIRRLREKVFSNNSFVSFPQKHIDFALKYTEKVFTQKENGELLSYALVDGKKIVELCCKENSEIFVSSVLHEIDAESAEVYMPLQSDGCKISRGMVYCLDEDLQKEIGENVFLSMNLE